MAIISEFYKRLRDLCEERNMTVNELVRVLNLSSGSPTAWKSGATPRRTTVKRIAEYFGVSFEYLLGISDGLSDDAKVKLARDALYEHIKDNPNDPSGVRIGILFEVSDYDRQIVCFNLDIDQCILDSWIDSYELPPYPIVDKFLKVFNIQVQDLLNNAELFKYHTELGEWTDGRKTAITISDSIEIARDLEVLIAKLDSGNELTFDGDPLTDAAKDSLRVAIKVGLEAAKLISKDRHTPLNSDKG